MTVSVMGRLAEELAINWKLVDGQYHHLDQQWRIVPAWIGRGFELFQRVDAPVQHWTVVQAFNSLDEAVHYFVQLSKV